MKKPKKKDKVEAGANVLIIGNRCYRCLHEWRPRAMEPRAKVCPKCKSPYWDRPKRKNGDNTKS